MDATPATRGMRISPDVIASFVLACFGLPHVTRFEKRFADVARVRCKIVFGNPSESAAGNMRNAFSKCSPVEGFGIVEINFGALGRSEVREVFVEGILADHAGAV